MDSIPDQCNYIEFVFLNDDITIAPDCYNVDLNPNSFNQLLEKMHKERIKPFRKQFKCYVHKTLYLENCEDLKVYEKKMVFARPMSDNVLVTYYSKEKRPYHMFPSTLNIHSVFYVKRLTFRIHNRIFVNFEVQYHPQEEKEILKAYINYNHDNDVDTSFINQEIDRLMKILLP